MADEVERDAEPEIMGMKTFQLRDDDADVLAALRDFESRDLFEREGIGERMGMRADAADAFDHDERLDEVFLGREFFDAAMVVADKDFRIGDRLAVRVETGVDRFFERGMVRPDRYDIAHSVPSFRPCAFSISSFIGVTMMWP